MHDAREERDDREGRDDTEELGRRAGAGDEGALSELVQRHLGELRGYVRRRLGARLRAKETSQDLVQSVCREMLEDAGHFAWRGAPGFRRWLLLRAERKIRDRGRYWSRDRRAGEREVALDERARAAGERLPEIDATPSRVVSAEEEVERVERAFRELPDDYRRVISLARVEGRPHAEVALELGRSRLATRSLLCRALARLATALERE